MGFLWLRFPLRYPIKYKTIALIYFFSPGVPKSLLGRSLENIPKVGWEAVLCQLRAQILGCIDSCYIWAGWPWESCFNLSVPQFPYLQQGNNNGTHLMYLKLGSPTPGLWPVRNWAIQQEVSSKWASKASPATPSGSQILNHPPSYPSKSMEKLSFTKPVPGAKTLGDCWSKVLTMVITSLHSSSCLYSTEIDFFPVP